MLPEDKNHFENPSEMASEARSALPISTNSAEYPNMDTIRYFSALLHGKKCVGGTSVRCATPCRPTCMFATSPLSVEINEHFLTCNPKECTRGHCREARGLCAHWKECRLENCMICTPVVKIITQNFCNHLIKKTPEMRDSITVRVLMVGSNNILKDFITKQIENSS